MNEDLSEFKYLIKLMQMAPKAPVPDHFNQNVMGRLAVETRESVCARVWNFLARPHEFTLNPIRALHRGMSNEERSLYFMLIAFAHLVLAAILFLGFRRIDSASVISPFLLMQPWVSLFLSVWLSSWGFLLKRNRKAGVRSARLAALVYTEIAVITGALLLLEFKAILLLIPFFAATAGLSVAAGIFLAVSCRSEEPGTIYGASVLV
jgi:hypothetical protein